MTTLSPRLRQGLAASPDRDGRHFHLYDPHHLTRKTLSFTRDELGVVQLLNGWRTLSQLSAETRAAGFTDDDLSAIISRLDHALFLHNERFQNIFSGPEREPSCVGCYPEDPAKIGPFFDKLFTAPGGPGLPSERGCRIKSDGRLRAALVPHIDYARGGVTYGWGFKEIVERTDASLFVIIATSHHSPERFTLTRQNFNSPLGRVITDQGYITRLEKHYGKGLFADPIAHIPEHSVELEVVLLQHLIKGPFRIVPMVVGSFSDCIGMENGPLACPDIRKMVAALRQVESETNEPICYIISGDLAHIGPKFGDAEPVAEPWLSESLLIDHALIEQAAAVNESAYFNIISEEEDSRRICGLPPTWLTLAATKPSKGELLHYGRYVHPKGFESVSFASMAFGE